MSFWAFSLTVIDLTTDLVPFLAALGFAFLVRNRLDLILAVANLCLLMSWLPPSPIPAIASSI